ncbi:hypothetical protein SERLA73DRAFT_148815 [Serpula lacrymans var. lacrymans S7.3]|uniref:Uncharacterized protein n=1 Tax=Serpula lacrymans var. lacrymans (strain S7.3) TaxID=936435 RepID=F8PF92_SERL3|nr:hypothetical protein SERLA73DRAFT_148815 [Serpula lacrymans var. lacrymans S7.3]
MFLRTVILDPLAYQKNSIFNTSMSYKAYIMVCNYYQRYHKDRVWFKVFVAFIWLQGTGFAVSVFYTIYVLTITQFGWQLADDMIWIPPLLGCSILFSNILTSSVQARALAMNDIIVVLDQLLVWTLEIGLMTRLCEKVSKAKAGCFHQNRRGQWLVVANAVMAFLNTRKAPQEKHHERRETAVNPLGSIRVANLSITGAKAAGFTEDIPIPSLLILFITLNKTPKLSEVGVQGMFNCEKIETTRQCLPSAKGHGETNLGNNLLSKSTKRHVLWQLELSYVIRGQNHDLDNDLAVLGRPLGGSGNLVGGGTFVTKFYIGAGDWKVGDISEEMCCGVDENCPCATMATFENVILHAGRLLNYLFRSFLDGVQDRTGRGVRTECADFHVAENVEGTLTRSVMSNRDVQEIPRMGCSPNYGACKVIGGNISGVIGVIPRYLNDSNIGNIWIIIYGDIISRAGTIHRYIIRLLAFKDNG